ncbi:U1 small nuclear ribonucleoprotein 70 kDa-like [Gigantopelta aegis]|uniref:U1 small nuclear ribonucleoprotein 70 kDa-like n=1 Tax=Gigantopelta aegis TaxID=1735272 RepID=UPI001B887A69|nr:U1 small nuclear ribonucleoprotein 70 kDa-like [Gigantopelta aegis]
MTQYLPPNLLALFAARDPMNFLPPVDKLSHEKKRIPYGGIGCLLKEFEDPKDTPPPTRVETRDEKKERKRKERQEQHAYKLEQDLALWDPAGNLNGDAYKTLFIARINYDTSESKLRREFEVYGPIKKISLVHDRNGGKPRGYAFIEYEHERDMHSAYKHADGKKIDGRRVLVDVERGRTVKGWRPRRLGGGLGGTRKGGPEVNTRFSGRDEYAMRDGIQTDERRPRSRSRERERPRRRSRSRDRRRSRSRERRRSRSKERHRIEIPDGDEDEAGIRKERKRARRSRSRERRRSRSRDRKRSRRSRSKERRRKGERGEGDEFIPDGTIKTEKTEDDYLYGGPDFRQQESNGMGNPDHSFQNNEENEEPPSEEYDKKVFITKPVEEEFPSA